ncbi:MAG: hypothetical protein ACLFNQ_10645 [Spirochaetaceae bacterium]
MKRGRAYTVILILSVLAAALLFILLGIGIRFARESVQFTNGIRRIDRFIRTEQYDLAADAVREMAADSYPAQRWIALSGRGLRIDDATDTNLLPGLVDAAILEHPDSETLHALRALVFLRQGNAEAARASAERLESGRFAGVVAETALEIEGDDSLNVPGSGLPAMLLSFSRNPSPEDGETIHEQTGHSAYLHTAILLHLSDGSFDQVETLLDEHAEDQLLSPLAFRFYATQRNTEQAAVYEALLDEETRSDPDLQLLLADLDNLAGNADGAEERYLRIMANHADSVHAGFARRAYVALQSNLEYRLDVLEAGIRDEHPLVAADYAVSLSEAGRVREAQAIISDAVVTARENQLYDAEAVLRILSVTLDETILPEQQEARVWAMLSRYPESDIYAHWLAIRTVHTRNQRNLGILREVARDSGRGSDPAWLDSVNLAYDMNTGQTIVEDIRTFNGPHWYAQYNRGLILARGGDLATAIDRIGKAIEQAQRRAVSSVIRASMHVRQAEVLLRANRPDEASEHVLRARSLDDENPRARMLERALLSRQG